MEESYPLSVIGSGILEAPRKWTWQSSQDTREVAKWRMYAWRRETNADPSRLILIFPLLQLPSCHAKLHNLSSSLFNSNILPNAPFACTTISSEFVGPHQTSGEVAFQSVVEGNIPEHALPHFNFYEFSSRPLSLIWLKVPNIMMYNILKLSNRASL